MILMRSSAFWQATHPQQHLLQHSSTPSSNTSILKRRLCLYLDRASVFPANNFFYIFNLMRNCFKSFLLFSFLAQNFFLFHMSMELPDLSLNRRKCQETGLWWGMREKIGISMKEISQVSIINTSIKLYTTPRPFHYKTTFSSCETFWSFQWNAQALSILVTTFTIHFVKYQKCSIH